MKTYSEIVMPIAMKLGAIIGFCYVLNIVLPVIIPFLGGILGLVFLFTPIVLLYKTIKSLCNQFNPEWTNGKRYTKNLVSLQLISFGAITFFFSGLIYALFNYIYLSYINPQYLNDVIALTSQILSSDLSVEEQIVVQSQLNSVTPSSMIASIVFTLPFFGLILSSLDVILLRIKFKGKR